MSHPDVRLEDGLERVGPSILRWSLFALFGYLIVVFGYHRTIAGLSMGWAATCGVLILALLVAQVLVRAGLTSGIASPRRMGEIGLLVAATMCAVLISDVVSGIVANVRGQGYRLAWESQLRRMRQDTATWQTDLMPPNVVPKGEYFRFYKAGALVEADAFGYLYEPTMLASRTLRDSVLQRRHFRYQIGPSGFRDPKPVSACRIFGVGDSFTFGFGVQGEETWPAQLEVALGQPVCNVGIADAAPPAEAALMRWLVNTRRARCVQQVVWMIFEGNDLDSDNEPGSDADDTGGLGTRLAGTVLQPVAELPDLIQGQSLIRKVLNHELFLPRGLDQTGIHNIDGVTLVNPLFRSDVLGPKLFFQHNIDRTQDRPSHITSSPLRPRVERAFRSMKDLAAKSGFDVTVVIAPMDARLYAGEFHGFPAIQEPYLINWFVSLAQSNGFRVVNLLPLFAPAAKHELLYLRDDVHFSARGGVLAAQVIADSLRAHGVARGGSSPQAICDKS